MCISPILIKNPHYGLSRVGYNYLHDCTHTHIPVPCGHCPQCVTLRQSYLVQRIYMEAINNYLYFVTLTYANSALPMLSVNDYSIPYADYTDLQNMFKRLRKSNAFSRPFKYFAVSEFGTQKGRPHFHLIISLPSQKSDSSFTPFNLEGIISSSLQSEWRRNYGSTRSPEYRPNFTLHSKFVGGRLIKNFDCHYIVPSLSDSGVGSCAYYVSKYMMKPSVREVDLQRALRLNLEPEVYNSVWKVVKNGRYMSKSFGLYESRGRKVDADIVSHIRKSIDFSKSNGLSFPVFLVPDSSKVMPLSRFYRNHFLTIDDASIFYFNQPEQSRIDVVHDLIEVDTSKYDELVRQHHKRLNVMSSKDLQDMFNY